MEITSEEFTLLIKGNLSDSMSDKEFFEFCQRNDSLQVERDENKQIIIVAPTSTSTGKYNADLLGELIIWNKIKNLGVCFDSSSGFSLPDGSVRSPDISWISKKNWNKISDKQKNEFAPICPDFVIELKSKSDSLKYLTNKMHKWIENGCALAWPINPANKSVFVFGKDGIVHKINGFNNILSGEEILPGFRLDLSILL
jgi:Uma2 family endonuclease